MLSSQDYRCPSAYLRSGPMIEGTAPTVRELSDEDFRAFIATTTVPALVEFWSEWCAPCEQFALVVEEIGVELGGRVVVGKVDIAANPDTVDLYQVASVPMLLIFVDGDVVRRIRGARPKAHVIRELSAYI